MAQGGGKETSIEVQATVGGVIQPATIVCPGVTYGLQASAQIEYLQGDTVSYMMVSSESCKLHYAGDFPSFHQALLYCCNICTTCRLDCRIIDMVSCIAVTVNNLSSIAAAVISPMIDLFNKAC